MAKYFVKFSLLGFLLFCSQFARADAYDATFIRQSVPAQVTAGERFAVSITMRNSGGNIWGVDRPFKLGSLNPRDNRVWGTSRFNLPGTVQPGAEVTFTSQVTAPATPGTYSFQWQMLEEFVRWFGQVTPNVSVNVVPIRRDAIVDVTEIPAKVGAGQAFKVKFTVQNTGNNTWRKAGGYRLGSQNPRDNTRWGAGRVELPMDIAPGNTVTFESSFRAPATAGTYPFQWQMLQELVTWFGGLSDNQNILVAGAFSLAVSAANGSVLLSQGAAQEQLAPKSLPSEVMLPPGEVVTLSATPSSGYLFDHWEGEPVDGKRTASATLAMDSDKVIRAVFKRELAIRNGDYYLGGQKFKGFGTFYLSRRSDNSDNLLDSASILLAALDTPACGTSFKAMQTAMSGYQLSEFMDGLSEGARKCLWDAYDRIYNARKSLVEAELSHIRNGIGMNSISTVSAGLSFNVSKFMPNRPGDTRRYDRDSMNMFACDELKKYLRIIKEQGLVVNALVMQANSSQGEACDPLAFLPEQKLEWDAFSGYGCIDTMKICDLANSDVSDAFLSYDVTWEPYLLYHPQWSESKLEIMDWYYHHFPDGRTYVDDPALNAENRAVSRDRYRGDYYKYLGKEWEKWLTDTYGSVAVAANLFPVPAGVVDRSAYVLNLMRSPYTADGAGGYRINNFQHQCNSGFDLLAASERRFMSDLLNRKYHDATEAIRKVDPMHSVSFRGLNPIQRFCDPLMFYDPREFAKNLGVVPAEHYNLTDYFVDSPAAAKQLDMFTPDAERWSKALIGFTHRYMSWNGLKPSHASEAGLKYPFSSSNAQASERAQSRFAQLLYMGAVYSDMDSISQWIYAWDSTHENVDFGLVNWTSSGPMISDKPRVANIRTNGVPMKTSSSPISQYITVDLDRYGDKQKSYNEGIQAIYNLLAANSSAVVGVKTVCDGKTSTDAASSITCLDNAAVAGRRCAVKCFNSQFAYVLVKDYRGIWVWATDGGTVYVTPNQDVSFQVLAENLLEGRWKTTNVKLHVRRSRDGATLESVPISYEVGPMGEVRFASFDVTVPELTGTPVATKVQLSLGIDAVGFFGEKFEVNLVPR